MKNLFIKITTGYDEDQKYTVSAEEAHKAYYIFMNPEKRAIFSNGLALTGKDIKGIKPDYNASMGWNPGYEIKPHEWQYIRDDGVERGLEKLMQNAKDVAYLAVKNQELLRKRMSEIKLPEIEDKFLLNA